MVVRDAELPHMLKITEAIQCDATEAASGLRGRTECLPGLSDGLAPDKGFH